TGPRYRGPRVVRENRESDDGSVPEPSGPQGDHHRRAGLLEGRVRDGRLSPSRTQEKSPPHLPRHGLYGRVRPSGTRREVAGDPEWPGPDAGKVPRPEADGGDPQRGRRPRRVQGGPGTACATAPGDHAAPHLRSTPE